MTEQANDNENNNLALQATVGELLIQRRQVNGAKITS